MLGNVKNPHTHLNLYDNCKQLQHLASSSNVSQLQRQIKFHLSEIEAIYT